MDLQSQGPLTFLSGYGPSRWQASCQETATFMTINLDISTPKNNLAPVSYKMHRLSWLVCSYFCTLMQLYSRLDHTKNWKSPFVFTGYEPIGSIRICGLHTDISNRHWDVVWWLPTHLYIWTGPVSHVCILCTTQWTGTSRRKSHLFAAAILHTVLLLLDS